MESPKRYFRTNDEIEVTLKTAGDLMRTNNLSHIIKRLIVVGMLHLQDREAKLMEMAKQIIQFRLAPDEAMNLLEAAGLKVKCRECSAKRLAKFMRVV